MLKFYTYLTIIISVLLLNGAVASSFSQDSASFLNANEIENFKYHIDIDTSVKLASKFNPDNKDNNYILLKSVHGQEYECYLPSNTYQDEREEEVEKEGISLSKNLNFTLVDEHIQNYSKKMKNNCEHKVRVIFFLFFYSSFICILYLFRISAGGLMNSVLDLKPISIICSRMAQF